MATANLDLESPSGFSFQTSFSDLLNGAGEEQMPKFKAENPPFLSLSPRPFSPSAFFTFPAGLSPAELLDSSVLLPPSQILPSPTTGSFPTQLFNWNSYSNKKDPPVKEEEKHYSDFSFQPSEALNSNKQESMMEIRKDEHQPAQSNENQDQKGSGDGYNWRKYGQKQVKGSENPRSYYKCSFLGCPTKKLVERSLYDGRITEIVYKGSHNHPKPQVTRRSSSSSYSSHQYQMPSVAGASEGSEQYHGSYSAATPENSSASFDDSREDSGEEERNTKRWKGEVEGGGAACDGFGNKATREPRVVVQTTSDVDILDDGYKWRKYGQKVVKGNPNPRSYYKCTTTGCPVRKHVERAPNDPRSVITTYEGKHNHDVPAARGSGLARPPLDIDMNGHHAADGGAVAVAAARQPSSMGPDGRPPLAFEMLKAPGNSYGFSSGGYDGMGGAYLQQQQDQRDDLFLETLAC